MSKITTKAQARKRLIEIEMKAFRLLGGAYISLKDYEGILKITRMRMKQLRNKWYDMPLPNAERRSNRIYPIIKGKTLEEIASGENPTIDNIGKPIDVMLLNEDELRRLVLIKLAITACKGDWDGFLT